MRRPSAGAAAAFLAAALPFAPARAASDAAPVVLSLTDGPEDMRWAAEVESRLGGAPAPAVVECAWRDDGLAALARMRRKYGPVLLLSRRERLWPAAAGEALSLSPAAAPEAAAKAVAARLGLTVSSAETLAAARARARTHLRLDDAVGAAAAARRAMSLAPGDAEAQELERQARSLGSTNMVRWIALRDAEREAAAPGLTDAERAAAETEAAFQRLRVGDAAGAEQGFRCALGLAPGLFEASFGLAGALRERSELAAVAAEQAAALAPTARRRADALRLAAECRLELGDGAAARAAARKALSAFEDLAGLELLARAEKSEAAAGRVARAAAREPLWRRAAAHRLAARVWVETGKPAAAVSELRKALELSPDDLDALEALVQLAHDGHAPGGPLPLPAAGPSPDEPPGPEPRILAALAADAEDLEALRQLIETRRLQGRRADAAALAERFRAAAARAPGWQQADAYRVAARLWRGLGDEFRALRTANEVEDLDPRSLETAKLLGEVRRLLRGPAQVDTANAYQALAQARLALGDVVGARLELERGLSHDPGSKEVLSGLTRIMLDLGRPAEALRYAERLAAAGGAPAERGSALRLKAQVQRALRDEGGAEASLKAALEADPVFPGTGPALAELLLAQGRAAEARRYADPRPEAGGKATDAELASFARLKARIALALGDEAGAQAALLRALELSPVDAEALAGLSRLALAAGRPGEALDLSRRLRLARQGASPAERAGVEHQAALASLALGDEPGARAALEKALALAPEHSQALAALARLHLQAGRAEKAAVYSARLLAVGGGGDAAALDASVRLARGDRAGAEAALERALAAQPGHRGALAARARLRLDAGRAGEALRDAAALVAASTGAAPGERADALRLEAAARLALGETAGAQERLEAALALDPDQPEALGTLARLRLDAGRYDEALAAARRLASSPTPSVRAAARRLEARALSARGDAAGAAGVWAEALKQDPADAESLAALAEGAASPAAALSLLEAHRPSGKAAAGVWRALRGLARARAGDRAGAAGDLAAAAASDLEGVCRGPAFRSRPDRLDLLWFDACLRVLPVDAALRADRGVARWAAGDRAGAVEDLRAALAARPALVAARLSLVSALAPTDPKEALEEAERGLAAAKGQGGPLYDRLVELRDALKRR